MPDHFTKSVFLQGYGGPGSIRVVKMGPGMTTLIRGLVINPPLLQKLFLLCTILQSGFYSTRDLD
jgi:hypothetical protein